MRNSHLGRKKDTDLFIFVFCGIIIYYLCEKCNNFNQNRIGSRNYEPSDQDLLKKDGEKIKMGSQKACKYRLRDSERLLDKKGEGWYE